MSSFFFRKLDSVTIDDRKTAVVNEVNGIGERIRRNRSGGIDTLITWRCDSLQCRWPRAFVPGLSHHKHIITAISDHAAKVIYLGQVLSTDGISVDEKKVSVIKIFPVPKNAQQLRSLLGISNYYRRFVKNFSIKTANLRRLLQRDAKFVWNSVHEQ